jgi:parallel beta-helix repeat protein
LRRFTGIKEENSRWCHKADHGVCCIKVYTPVRITCHIVTGLPGLIYHNANYGLDPHTGTHDMIIRNNNVHDNGAQEIICSLNCYDVLIENNQIYNNGGAGIMFSRNMSNSVARNNIIFNEDKGILISQSYYNSLSSFDLVLTLGKLFLDKIFWNETKDHMALTNGDLIPNIWD